MMIAKVPVTAVTYGGYVNVSRQDIDWTQPQIMDIVISDLAGVYAQETEDVARRRARRRQRPPRPRRRSRPGPHTAAGRSPASIWTAAGTVYAATKGQGRLIIAVAAGHARAGRADVRADQPAERPVDRLLSAGNFGQGAIGIDLRDHRSSCRPQLAAGTMIVASTAAAEVYEDRVGALQVVEPSVLGVQVAYAGYFAPLVVEATGRSSEDREDPLMAGEQFDDPNRQAVGLDPAWVEGTGGEAGEAPEPQAAAQAAEELPEKLPGQHAGLDELAHERGYEWSRDDLTVAEKQAELGGGWLTDGHLQRPGRQQLAGRCLPRSRLLRGRRLGAAAPRRPRHGRHREPGGEHIAAAGDVRVGGDRPDDQQHVGDRMG